MCLHHHPRYHLKDYNLLFSVERVPLLNGVATMTLQIALVLAILALTVFLFVTELVRVDIVAIVVMISLPWLGLVDVAEAFSGFASNAVVAIIAIMILGYGVDRSGAMNRLIHPIVSAAKSNEKRLIVFVSITVGLISAFMQNIGAAALFLPAMLRIAKKTGMPDLPVKPRGLWQKICASERFGRVIPGLLTGAFSLMRTSASRAATEPKAAQVPEKSWLRTGVI